jgi:hypothetical protein
MMAITVGGCGISTAVPGTPVPATADATTQDSTTPSPTSVPIASANPSPTVEQSTPPQSQPETTVTSTGQATPEGPAAVVRAYFDAINARDYQRAWALGGKNTGQAYATFAAGFAATDRDILTIQSVQGNTVTADLTAIQTDGTKHTYHGTYTVTDDTVTRFSVRATG